MAEYNDNKQVLRNEIDAILKRQESGEPRPEAEQKLLRSFVILISDIIELTNAFKRGTPVEHGRPITSQEISLKQKELWMLCLKINDMSAKSKIVGNFKLLHPELATIELEIR